MRKRILAAGLLSLCLQSCSNGAVDLNADFRQDGNTLIIVNHDGFTYNKIDVTVNKDYHYKAESLAPTESLSIPMREFANDKGARFTPATSKMVEMALYAESSDGKPGRVELTRNQ
jgi:hypothetical protein